MWAKKKYFADGNNQLFEIQFIEYMKYINTSKKYKVYEKIFTNLYLKKHK